MIFVDEISMVGNSMFQIQLNNRLKDIKGCREDFRGVSIIAIGDLFQLELDIFSKIMQFLPQVYGINTLKCLGVLETYFTDHKAVWLHFTLCKGKLLHTVLDKVKMGKIISPVNKKINDHHPLFTARLNK